MSRLRRNTVALGQASGAGARRMGGTWGVVRYRTYVIPGHNSTSDDWTPPVSITDESWVGNRDRYRAAVEAGAAGLSWQAGIDLTEFYNTMPFVWSSWCKVLDLNASSVLMAGLAGSVVKGAGPATIASDLAGGGVGGSFHASTMVIGPESAMTWRAAALDGTGAHYVGGHAATLRVADTPLGWLLEAK